MGEEVALAFAADVGQAVAGVRELTGSARELAGTAKEAADGVGSLAEPAGAAADAVKGVAASAGEADKALIGSRDAAAAASGGYERLAGAARGAAAAQKDVAARSAESAAAQEGSAAKADASAGAFAGLASKAALAALGVGVLSGVSVAMAARFQDATTHLVTDAGESAANLKMVQQGILQVSAATGQGALEITNAMYHVESSGFHGAQGLAVLKVAAEGARVGGADLDTVGKALVGTMNAYGMSSKNAAEQTHLSVAMMNELIAAVGAGDMRMQDLASSLGNVAPVAATAKIKFSEVGGALATMTAQNMSAQQATQDLRHTIVNLENPSKVARKELAGLGLSATDLQNNLGQRGLSGTLEIIAEAARRNAGALGQTYVQAVAKALNGTTGMNTALMLTGTHMSTFRGNIATVAAAAVHGGNTVANWAAIQGTFAFQLDKAKASAEAVAISFGLALLPTATRVMGVIASLGQWMAKNTWAAVTLAGVISGVLAVVIGGKFLNAVREGVDAFRMLGETEFLQNAAESVGSFVSQIAQQMGRAALATGQWIIEHTVAAATFIAQNLVMAASATAAFIAENAATLGIIAGIALLVAGIIYLATHWKQVWGDVKAVALAAWRFLDGEVIHPIMRGVNDLVRWVESHWRLLATILATVLLGPVGGLVVFIATHWALVRRLTGDLVRDVTGFFARLPGMIMAAINWLPSKLLEFGGQVVMGFLHGIEHAAGSVLSYVGNLASSVAGSFASALGIGSPSRVFFRHAVDTLQGYINGWKSKAPELLALARDGGGGIGSVGAGSAVGGPAYGGGSLRPVNVTVPITISGGGITDPRALQALQNFVQEAVLRYMTTNPSTGFILPGRVV